MAVYKSKNGKWYCQGMVKGQRYHKLCDGAKSQEEAKAIEDAERYRIRQVQGGIIQDEGKQYRLKYLKQLYFKYAETNNKDFKHVKCRINLFENFIGSNTIISKIFPKDIERFKRYLLDAGLLPSTVNRYFSNIHKMFNVALDNDLLIKNPCRNMKKLIEDNEIINVYSIPEEIELHKHLPPVADDIVTFAFISGQRKSNIRLLKFSNVNLNFNFIEIQASKFKGGRTHIIPLTKELKEIINRNKNNSDYVFINPETNKPYSDDRLSYIFKSACKAAGIEGKRFHDIRHTTATRLLEKGVDIMTVKELLGHSSVAITQKYTHTNINKKREALELLYSYK